MTTAPAPATLAHELERLATALRNNGPRAVELAALLAARGWPSHGDGTGRTQPECSHTEGECTCGVTLTSTEAAATTPTKWAGVDARLAADLRTAWLVSGRLLATIADVVAHADPEQTDRPNRQAGSGNCIACGDFASGASGDRLRSGFDDKCRKAWERAGRPDRAWWVRRRREELAPQPVVHVDPTVVGSPS